MLEASLLEQRVIGAMRTMRWEKLTPIQQKAIPVLLRKRNALLVSPTGSGKTEAAVMPVFTLLSSQVKEAEGVRLLYVTPLRALNRDMLRRMNAYGETFGLTVGVRHGDTPDSARRKMAEHPPDVVITTPETLAVLLSNRRLRNHMRSIEWVVVDELHELIGNERGCHLSLSLERLSEIAEREFTRVGLSATIGDLGEAAKFLCGEGRPCAILVDDSFRRYRMECRYVQGQLSRVADEILEMVRSHGREKSTLLFTNTRDEAEYMTAILRARSPDIPIDIHHGSLSREFREETEARMRSSEAGIVVCTSSLELGLDIGSVDHVIQLGSPRQAVKLVQRVGRSRHRVGEEAYGTAITNRLDDELESLALMERVTRRYLEPNKDHKNAFDVLAHHLTGLALERGYCSSEEVMGLVTRAYPFKDLTALEFDQSLRLLERQGILSYDGAGFKGRGPRTYQYYYENLSTIPEIEQYDIVDLVTKKTVGRLDQSFVGEFAEAGRTFILKGSSWRVLSMDDSKKRVHVEPASRDAVTIPYWVGELIPVDFETGRLVGSLRRKVLEGRIDAKVSEEQRKRIEETRDKLGLVPDERKIVMEARTGSYSMVIHSCFGTKVNHTLASILSTFLSSKTGRLVEARSDPYRILLSSTGFMGPKLVEDVLKEEKGNLEEILEVAILGTHPMNWKTWHVAKKFGVISKGAQYDKRALRLIQERYRETPLYREVLREVFFQKFDLEKTRIILKTIRNGQLKVEVREVDEFSPLAKPILEHASAFVSLPFTLDRAVLEILRERLANGRHRLVCLTCGRWERVLRTREIEEPVRCSLCKSRIVARTYSSDDDLIRMAARRARGLRLNEDEEKKFRRAWKTSSLIQNFGKTAIVVLSGFGVGPDTAARVLRQNTTEEDIYRGIYMAERNYVATRGFWEE